MPKRKSLDVLLSRYTVSEAGCWEWTGTCNQQGYGAVTMAGDQPGSVVTRSTHRLQWTRVNGPIPKDMAVLHRCDNPPCINPEHLFLGTTQDNLADMRAKGRGNTTGLWQNIQWDKRA